MSTVEKVKMKFRAAGVQKTSGVGDVLPWTARHVALIHVSGSGSVCYENSKTGKRELLLKAIKQGGIVLAAWPGEWRQDIFVVDDLEAAIAAL